MTAQGATPARRIGVYPGTFDPPTVAHLAVARAARDQCRLHRVELVLSADPLGKPDRAHTIEERAAALRAVVDDHDWLGLRVTTRRLLVEIAEEAAAVALIMGADKWAQVCDPGWYGSVEDRDEVLARLPLVAVAPRPPHLLPAAEPGRFVRLDLDPAHHEVSSTAVRGGRNDWAL